MRVRKSKLTLIMFMVIVITVSQLTMISYAYKSSLAIVIVTGTLNVRVGPGTNNARLLDSTGTAVSLRDGMQVTIVDEDKDSSGTLWYKIQFDYNSDKNLVGYVHSAYISKISDDQDFEAYLTEQGFPESYKSYLRVLHTKYPTWKFVAQHTKLDWNTVIANESKIGTNLVHTSSLDSWKSIESGAFDWNANKWIGYDGASWVPASSAIISYFMDPRNMLTETAVFQFEQLTYQPYHTLSGVQSILKGTFMSGTYDSTNKTYAQTFIEAAEKTNASPYMIAARCRQEMGVNGTSSIISGTVAGYEGYYNYFNIGAYTTSSASAIINGLKYAKGTDSATLRPWNTRYKAIIGGATYIANQYVNKGQDTLYLQKFNVQGSNLYNHQYMTNVQAANSEASSIKSAHNSDLNKAITFKIPVYLNMPSSACPKPTGTGNPNNLLNGLSVTNHQLTPSFSSTTTEYSLVVEHGVESIELKGTTIDSKAKVTGTGNKALSVGNNKLTVEVTAENGSKKSYVVTVYRKEAPPVVEGGTITSSVYDIGDCITGVTPGTTVEEFRKNIQVDGGTISILNQDGTENTTVIKTNTIVRTSSGDTPVIIYGDVNGDGMITSLDLLYVQRHLLEVSLLKGNYLAAADTNRRNDGITSLDLLYLQRHLLEVNSIVQ